MQALQNKLRVARFILAITVRFNNWRKISSACDLVAEMLLILKNIIFDLIIQGKILDMTDQINVP